MLIEVVGSPMITFSTAALRGTAAGAETGSQNTQKSMRRATNCFIRNLRSKQPAAWPSTSTAQNRRHQDLAQARDHFNKSV